MITLQEIKLDNLKGNEYILINVTNNKGCINLEPNHYTFTELLDILLSKGYTEKELAQAIDGIDFPVGKYVNWDSNLKINDTD